MGRWTAAQLTARDVAAAVVAALEAVPAGTSAWDLRAVQGLDHLGAQLLWNQWGRAWPAEVQLAPSQRAVIEHVARYSTVAPALPPDTWWARFNALGALVLQGMGHAVDLTRLIGQLGLDLVKLAAAPREGPWRDVSGHVYHIGATALPITALVGALVGIVLAYLTSQQLRQFGADAFIDASAVDDTVAAIKDEGLPNGVDHVFECVGHPALIRQGIALLDWGGTLTLLGVPKLGTEAAFVVNDLYNDRSILGCRYGATRPHHDIPRLMAFYRDGRLLLDEMVSQIYPLDHVGEALEDLHHGKLNRGVLAVTD
jgi:hypothetical protein